MARRSRSTRSSDSTEPGMIVDSDPKNAMNTANATLSPIQDENWRYESAVEQIESIVEQIESGELELADVFEQFGMAVEQLQQCEAYLARHQQQLDLIIETLADTAADRAEALDDF